MSGIDWSTFGLIKCINLLERDDRYETAKEFFTENQIPVEFHRVKKHPNGGVQGCFESHIQVITEAYNNDYDRVLIFEDDVEAGKGFCDRKLREAIDFMNQYDLWNIMFLGWHPLFKTRKTQQVMKYDGSPSSIFRVSAFGGHAYVMSRSAMSQFVDKKFEGIPIDVYYSNLNGTYAVYPSVFVQRGSPSSLVSNFSASKNMKPIRQLIENWSVNVNYPVNDLLRNVVLIIIVGIVVWLGLRKVGDKSDLRLALVLAFILFSFISIINFQV